MAISPRRIRTQVRRHTAVPAAFIIAAFATSLSLIACSSQTSSFGPSGGDGGAPPANTSDLPLVEESDLGGKCSGFGTSIGDTAAMPSDSCPAGLCLADAREGLELYCTADCTKARCPEGWLCEETTVVSKRVCFRDPDAPQGGDEDASATSWLDKELPSYRVGSTSKGTASLRDYVDATKKKHDLVVLIISGAWSVINQAVLDDAETFRSSPRVAWISVLVEGWTYGDPATETELTKWHKELPEVDKMFDPGLVVLKPAVKKGLQGFPTFVGLDAASLDYLGEQMGVEKIEQTIETWREKATQ